MKHTLIACLIGAALVTTGLGLQAASSPGASAASSSATAKRAKQMPFRGKVTAVDTTAKTITLAGKLKPRTLLIKATSRIQREGKPALLEELRPGESVGGLARANDGGEWEIVTLNIGLKPTSPKGTAKEDADPME